MNNYYQNLNEYLNKANKAHQQMSMNNSHGNMNNPQMNVNNPQANINNPHINMNKQETEKKPLNFNPAMHNPPLTPHPFNIPNNNNFLESLLNSFNTGENISLLKSFIPFLSPESKKLALILIKLLEIQNIINTFDEKLIDSEFLSTQKALSPEELVKLL